ncbi:MAG: hypothetical protein P4N41_17980 [Negativicutes bacterium]|nr:hypothetical protein [Negativicutes bacterium]
MPLVHIEDVIHDRRMKNEDYRDGYEWAKANFDYWWGHLPIDEMKIMVQAYKAVYELDKHRNINALGMARYLEERSKGQKAS